jgi:lipid-A-disaccharide synthase
VDFPGFNMRIGKILKQKKSNLKITYLCPPQMWCWGAWRIKKLKHIADKIVVLYPSEVEWYKIRGIKTEWLGNPVFMRLERYFKNTHQPLVNFDLSQRNTIAIIPGSRISEIKTLLPNFANAAYQLSNLYPDLKFVIPAAESLSLDILQKQVNKSDLGKIANKIEFVRGEEAKIKALQNCRLALSKPGTATLELALLGIPTVVAYKTSWLTYFVARLLSKVKYMSLPNLLLDQEVFPEIIQHNFTASNIVTKLKSMHEGIATKSRNIDELINKLQLLKQSLEKID